MNQDKARPDEPTRRLRAYANAALADEGVRPVEGDLQCLTCGHIWKPKIKDWRNLGGSTDCPNECNCSVGSYKAMLPVVFPPCHVVEPHFIASSAITSLVIVERSSSVNISRGPMPSTLAPVSRPGKNSVRSMRYQKSSPR